VTSSRFRETEPFDRPSQLVRGDTRVALRRIEVLVAEELLDLAKVCAGTEQLRGEDVTQRVGRDAFPFGHACGPRVAENCLGQDRLRQPLAVYADEECRLGVARTDLEIINEELLEHGMDGESSFW
jgi:hypothetical protein